MNLMNFEEKCGKKQRRGICCIFCFVNLVCKASLQGASHKNKKNPFFLKFFIKILVFLEKVCYYRYSVKSSVKKNAKLLESRVYKKYFRFTICVFLSENQIRNGVVLWQPKPRSGSLAGLATIPN